MKHETTIGPFNGSLMQQLWAQSENQPLQRSIEVDPLSKSLLKVPEDNALPDFLKKEFLSNTAKPNEAPKSFEKDIQMGIREAFIDPGDEFLKRLQTPESDKIQENLKSISIWETLKVTVKVYELFFVTTNNLTEIGCKFAITIKSFTPMYCWLRPIKNWTLNLKMALISLTLWP